MHNSSASHRRYKQLVFSQVALAASSPFLCWDQSVSSKMRPLMPPMQHDESIDYKETVIAIGMTTPFVIKIMMIIKKIFTMIMIVRIIIMMIIMMTMLMIIIIIMIRVPIIYMT